MQQLSTQTFRNAFVQTFPGDASGNLQPRQTPNVLYSRVQPTPVRQPGLLAWSESLAKELGMAPPDATDLKILAGNATNPSMLPYAACYAGHQFGQWAGQLGDGRAITLGEWPAPDGRSWELQLKGAGPTPYSRRADGRAVLRSSVREYLMSEAMHYLGVPTTRALSLVTTGDPVLRDLFYNGNAAYEPGAIVLRVAPSFLRFGNFEMLAARGEVAHLEQLVQWTIERYYPHLTGPDKIIRWFEEVVDRTAALMVEWMRVGFVHGVMNTDNMSILGLTIDYGPYSFVDAYDPGFTPNTTDLPGRRYAFGKQMSVAHWNLACLANALAPLFEEIEPLQAALDAYGDVLLPKYYHMMARKLGLEAYRAGDEMLFSDLEKMLATVKPDMTLFYQQLLVLPQHATDTAMLEHFSQAFYADLQPAQQTVFLGWLNTYIERVAASGIAPEARNAIMQAANPRFVLRNYLLHQAIEELESGTNTLFTKLQEAIKEPYSNRFDELIGRRPEWAAEKAGCSMLSCSS